jgi:DegV family protein with EDD domain
MDLNLIKIPYFVNGKLQEKEYGTDFDKNSFYNSMLKGANTSTSGLNPSEYIDIFEPVLESGEDILYISFSHDMSGTFAQMDTAISQLQKKYSDRKITVVNTRQMSIGAGVLVWLAALKHSQGVKDDEIIDYVMEVSKREQTYVTVDDLKYLKRGGRISGFTAFVGGVLNIKPILKMEDGKLIKMDKVKGRKASLKYLLNKLKDSDVDLSLPICIMSAQCDDDSNSIATEIKTSYPNAEIWQKSIGPVIGCHCGPGTLGIVFFLN